MDRCRFAQYACRLSVEVNMNAPPLAPPHLHARPQAIRPDLPVQIGRLAGRAGFRPAQRARGWW